MEATPTLVVISPKRYISMFCLFASSYFFAAIVHFVRLLKVTGLRCIILAAKRIFFLNVDNIAGQLSFFLLF